jgi:uncharacterized protein (DUF433 family)
LPKKRKIMEFLSERITISPDLCNGKPTIRGLRITVKTILEFLSAGETIDEILKQYPDLVKEDIDARLKFASDLMDRNYVIKATTI